MTPTNELRFVEREVPSRHPIDGPTTVIRVLQQKWLHDPRYDPYAGVYQEAVWRDVPLASEGETK